MSGRRVGEALLLQEHRGARDLLRTSPHLPPDGGAGSRPGGGIQEQEGGCTVLTGSYKIIQVKGMLRNFVF